MAKRLLMSPDVEPGLLKAVARLGRAKDDRLRQRIAREIAGRKPPYDIDEIEAAFAKLSEARWAFPQLLQQLAEMHGDKIEPVLGRLLQDKDPSSRANTIGVIQVLGWVPRFTRQLVELLNDQDAASPFLAAIESLESSPSDEVFAAFRRLWTAGVSNPYRRGNVLRALAKHSRPSAAALFRRVEKDAREHPYVRLMGTYGLARLGDYGRAQQLRTALEDPNEDVSTGAALALFEILGMEPNCLPTGIRRLAKWWDSNQASARRRVAALGESE